MVKENILQFIDLLHRIMELAELLDKQENEIKFLKGELEIQEGCSISKDKIREKIKKAKEINWHTPKLVIEYFEELLEENTNE